MPRYPHEATFSALGLDCLLITTCPEDLLRSVDLVVEELEELAAVTSLDLHTSEASRLTRLAWAADVTAPASPVLIDYLSAALWAAELTDSMPSGDSRLGDWRRIEIGDGTVSLPRGCVLDLGDTVAAHAADLLVLLLSDLHPGGGFLLGIGNGLAVAGEAPDDGWQIPVTAPSGRTLQVVSTRRAAVSSTIDHGHGTSDAELWAKVTVAAGTALEAQAWAAASRVKGELAPAWLTNRGVPARLERRTGTTRYTAGWPAPVRMPA
ncbi:hypothetical protein G7085_07100 [Tessaracoccus sp. HDW20]|uniref:hypothetical protein n=1 Tax=Tessaracoccus coleopterorum TaxID=2714950 RepID=UPI0018D44D03|nr:hypothetical protein [Tessaracoccus coleopterorum]NHB84453.1 hypothetical protein [Tessaracoccus coleopterorum]